MNKKFIEALAGTLGLKAEELAQVIASEEEATMDLPKGKFYSETDIETLKDNYGKERYDAGKTAGYEMSYKDLSKASGIETVKNGEDFVKSYKDKILEDAKIEPEKKVQELTESMQALQQKLQDKEKAFKDLEISTAKEKQKLSVQSMFPDMSETTGLTKEEATSLFFMQHEIGEDGTITRNGKVLKDDLENPLDLAKATEQFVSEKGWNTPKVEGRGGGANGGRGGKQSFDSIEAFESHLQEKGISLVSAEGQALLHEAAKERPELLDE